MALMGSVLLGCAHAFPQPASIAVDRARFPVDHPTTWPAAPPDDDFRMGRPLPRVVSLPDHPEIQEGHLSNGIRVLLVERHDLPIVTFGVGVNRGDIDAPPGQFSVMFRAMTLASRATPGREYWTYLAAFGVERETQPLSEHGNYIMRVLPTFVRGPARLLGEAITQPEFEADKFEERKKSALDALTETDDSLHVARVLAASLTYPPGHPYGRSMLQRVQSITALTQKDAVALHRALVSKDSVTVVASGDIAMPALLSAFEKTLGTMTSTANPRVVVSVASTPRRKLVVVNQRSLRQDMIVVNFLGVPFDHPDYPALSVLKSVVAEAGWAHTRLEQGSSYGVAATFARRRGPAALEFSWKVDPDGTARSLTDLLKTLVRAQTQVLSSETVESIKQVQSRSGIDTGDSNIDTLGALAQIASLELSIDDWNKLIARVDAVTPEDVQRVAKKYLDLDHMVLVAAGDASRLVPIVTDLGLGAPELQ